MELSKWKSLLKIGGVSLAFLIISIVLENTFSKYLSEDLADAVIHLIQVMFCVIIFALIFGFAVKGHLKEGITEAFSSTIVQEMSKKWDTMLRSIGKSVGELVAEIKKTNQKVDEVTEKARTKLDLIGEGQKVIKPQEDFNIDDESKLLLEEAQYYLRIDDYENAVRKLKGLHEKHPDNAEICWYLGYAYFKQNRFREAIEILEIADQKMPDNKEIRHNLGASYYNAGQYDKAIKCLEFAVDEGVAESHNFLGLTYWKTGRYDEAIDITKKFRDLCVENDSKNRILVADNNLAYYYYEKARKTEFADKSNLDEAFKFANEAIAGNPNQDKFYDTLGCVYLWQGDLDKAIETFQQGISINPKNPYLVTHLNDSMKKLGLLEEVEENEEESEK